MTHPIRKFVAVLLAVWLPLFSGNALASAVAMHSNGGGCQSAAAQQDGHRSQQAAAMHQHMHHAQSVIDHDQSAGPHDQQDSSCNNSGVCQMACCAYLAAPVIEVAQARLLVQPFTSPSTQFQSFTSAPLDPPPLSRV